MSVRIAQVAALSMSVGAVVFLLSSCAQVGNHTSSGFPTHAIAQASAQRVAQVGYGRDAPYLVCHGDACPSVTPKTIAVRSASVEAPPVVRVGATQRSEPVTQSSAVIEAPQPPTLAPRQEHLLVNFVTGSAALTLQGRAALDATLPLAKKAERIVISGRTDIVGSEKVNETFAFARALAVRDHIRERLPDLDNVIAIAAKGRCCFIAGNDTEEGRAKNRRVEVVFNLRG